MDYIDLNSRREDDDDDDDEDDNDDWDTNVIVNGRGSPKDVRDCDAQRDVTLAENVGVLTLLPHCLTRNCNIQHSSALLNGNISNPLSPVSELTSPSKLDKATTGTVQVDQNE
jgi:hypothetical protein